MESWWIEVSCSCCGVEDESPAASLIWLFTFSIRPKPSTIQHRPCWICFFRAFVCCWPVLLSHDSRKTFLLSRVRRALHLHSYKAESLTPHVPLLFNWTEHFSRKEQLLPALVVLLSWPLLCADSRADFVHGCSHAEWGEQEELSRTAGLCLLLLWLWFNHCRATLYPSTLKEERNVLTRSLLMELKAIGVFLQRGDHQPLNVGSSSSKPHLTIHSPHTVISKWPPFCACSQRSTTQGGGTRPGEILFSWCCWSHLLLVLLWMGLEWKKFSVLRFLNRIHFQFCILDAKRCASNNVTRRIVCHCSRSTL